MNKALTTEGQNSSSVAAVFAQGKTNPADTAANAHQVQVSSAKYQSIEFQAIKQDGSPNASNVRVGFSPVAANNLRVLQPGETWPLEAPAGMKIDISTIYYVPTTLGDQLTWTVVV